MNKLFFSRSFAFLIYATIYFLKIFIIIFIIIKLYRYVIVITKYLFGLNFIINPILKYCIKCGTTRQ